MADDAPLAAAKHGKPTALAARAVTINQPLDEVYSRFRDFAAWPAFMENVVRIDVYDERHSHWVVKAPGGSTVEWDARITEEVPGKLLAWESEPGAEIPNRGQVEFRDAGARGTVVVATIDYDPPAGVIGKVIAKMFQREPAIQARRDLRRFKQLLETGEIATPAMNAKQFEEMGL
ncbi:SRPBCC family protein [Sphingomonas sp. 8AM]|uniref:SRPBCC family protein n=1 Tax=Sphingomonas sp. 8AM TaxID=2653170 RepID=UPI0012F2D200|nr:SRPBCC family protein [Sphingomonas sp. 8AM]VXC59513.1 Cyclase [Sphingomonas sp. 8AM]